mgnify:CR=1 FL=1
MNRYQIRRLVKESIERKAILNEIRSNPLIIERVDQINHNMPGYHPRVIEESIMDIFGKGMVSAFKSQVVEYLADLIGIDKQSVVYRFLMNFIEEFNILGMGKYFEKGKCKEIPALVARAGIETITELQGAELIKVIYYTVTGQEKIKSPELLDRLDNAVGGLIAAAGRETVNEFIYEWIGPIIEPKIEAIFCKYNGLKDFLYSGVYKGGVTDELGDLAKVGAAGALGAAAVDSGLDAANKKLSDRDDARRAGSGKDLANQIFGIRKDKK